MNISQFKEEARELLNGTEPDKEFGAGYTTLLRIILEVFDGELFGEPNELGDLSQWVMLYVHFDLPLSPVMVLELSYECRQVIKPVMHLPFVEWLYRLCTINKICPLVPNRQWLLEDPYE